MEGGYDFLKVLSANQTVLLNVTGSMLLQPTAPRYVTVPGGAQSQMLYIAFESDSYIQNTGFLLR